MCPLQAQTPGSLLQPEPGRSHGAQQVRRACPRACPRTQTRLLLPPPSPCPRPGSVPQPTLLWLVSGALFLLRPAPPVQLLRPDTRGLLGRPPRVPACTVQTRLLPVSSAGATPLPHTWRLSAFVPSLQATSAGRPRGRANPPLRLDPMRLRGQRPDPVALTSEPPRPPSGLPATSLSPCCCPSRGPHWSPSCVCSCWGLPPPGRFLRLFAGPAASQSSPRLRSLVSLRGARRGGPLVCGLGAPRGLDLVWFHLLGAGSLWVFSKWPFAVKAFSLRPQRTPAIHIAAPGHSCLPTAAGCPQRWGGGPRAR